LVRAVDNGSISRSEFASMVEPGMIVELSIVVRQRLAFQEDTEKCPRCDFVNLNVAAHNGWIEWQVHLRFLHARPFVNSHD
jgi:hypothetical protein